MNESKQWFIREYLEGDEKEIVSFYNHTFRRNRTLTHWNWKFKNNPYSKQIIASVACTETTNKIIGHNSVIPLQLNFLGNPINSGQFSDIMVHTNYRNQGIFIKNAELCFELCKKAKITAIYVFPNKKSYPGFMNHLKGRRIAYFQKYLKRLKFSKGNNFYRNLTISIINFFYINTFKILLSAEKYILNKRKKNSSKIKFVISNNFPDNYDELWNSIKSYEVLSVWKDAKYLKWRYLFNPDNKFEYIYLAENGKILALAVVLLKNQEVMICELFVKDKNLLNSRLLINRIQNYYLRKRVNNVSFTGFDNGFFDQIFKSFESYTQFRYVFCGHVFNPKNKLNDYFPYPFNWSFTYGDIDTV